MVITAARIVLGGIFLVSGSLKLRDPGWRRDAPLLGVPRLLVPAVPLAEIVLGALLAAGVAVTWAAAAAVAVLAAFTLVLLRVMRRPAEERPRCACFGRFSAGEVGAASVLRNTVFLALALLVLVGD